ncbi:MAG: helix-turn-helix domain-containing protein [Leucobacter sp.]
MSDTRDETIGKRVAHYRGDIPQKQLADLMRDLGWKWSQATVWSIEKGERPLRLAEAEDLCGILRVEMHQLLASEITTNLIKLRDRLVREMALVQSEIDDLERIRREVANEFLKLFPELDGKPLTKKLTKSAADRMGIDAEDMSEFLTWWERSSPQAILESYVPPVQEEDPNFADAFVESFKWFFVPTKKRRG